MTTTPSSGLDWSPLNAWRYAGDLAYDELVKDEPSEVPKLDQIVTQYRTILEDVAEVDLHDPVAVYHLIAGWASACALIDTQATSQCADPTGMCLFVFQGHFNPGVFRLQLVSRELLKNLPGIPPVPPRSD